MDIKEIECKLLKGNELFCEDIRNNSMKKNIHLGLKTKQSPYILIVCCSDSRVIPENIFNTYFGEIFVIRTAGNVINEGELASIEYGLAHLNIKYVLIMGHTSCGAIHATIKNESGEYLSPILNRIKRNIGDINDECLASEINAKNEALYLKDKFSKFNDVTFKSALYDLNTNKVRIME